MRCDRCGARAASRATKDATVLHFCGHHSREHTPALRDKGFDVVIIEPSLVAT